MKLKMGAGINKNFLRFHRRQLEIAVQCFEEVQKKPAGFFYEA